MSNDLSIDDRREMEMQLLSEKTFLPLADLAAAIGVSDSTVRRDLEALEGQGRVRRTHGGAVFAGNGGSPPPRPAADAIAAEQKAAIARAVADLIAPGQTVMLNGGSTCYQVARALQGRRLSVVTNSVAVAALLCGDLATEVTVVGGYVYPRIGVAVGAMADRQLESLHASRLVTSCAGLSPDGAFEPNQLMVDVERRMMANADEVVLLADSTKLGVRSVVKLAGLDELDVIVTDSGADEQARQWLERCGARVIYAAVDR